MKKKMKMECTVFTQATIPPSPKCKQLATKSNQNNTPPNITKNVRNTLKAVKDQRNEKRTTSIELYNLNHRTQKQKKKRATKMNQKSANFETFAKTKEAEPLAAI